MQPMKKKSWKRVLLYEYPRWQTRRNEGSRDDDRFVDYEPTIEWVQVPYPSPTYSKILLQIAKLWPQAKYPLNYGCQSTTYRKELIQVPVTKNDDLPFNKEWIEMGLEEDPNPILDIKVEERRTIELNGCKVDLYQTRRTMNDAHFRELCEQYGSQLLALHHKNGSDEQPLIYTQPERLEEWLECDYLDAHTIGHAMRRLKLNKEMARKAVFGYTQSDGIRKRGIQECGDIHGEYYAEMFEELAVELPDLPNPGVNEPRSLDDDRLYYYDVACKLVDNGQLSNNPIAIMTYIEQSAARDQLVPEAADPDGRVHYYEDPDIHPDQIIYVPLEDDEPEDEYLMDAFGDEEDVVISDGIGTHPLSDGFDSLDNDYLDRVRQAGPKKIKKLQQEMFRQFDEEWGRYRKPVNDWMTDRQKRFAWWFINERKEKITEEAKSKISKTTAEVIDLMSKIKHMGQRKALIACYCRGKEFDLQGYPYSWDYQPNEYEIWYLWHCYNE
jgi:hypothetical protein